MHRRTLLPLLLASTLGGTVIDGIVATVGRVPITDSMVRRNLRVAALLAREPLQESRVAWRESRERMIEQTLIREEIRLSRYPVAQPDEIRNAMAGVVQQFGGKAALDRALAAYAVTEADLAESVGWRITFARFLSYRFRPSVQITDDLLRAYYVTWRPGAGRPPFEEARDAVEADFVAAQTDRQLESWLTETRRAARIELIEPRESTP